jgi:hypothetical protein
MAQDSGFMFWLSEAGRLLSNWAPGFGLVSAVFVFVTDTINRVVGAGLTFVGEKIDQLDLTALKGAQFTTIQAIGYANAIFPLSEALNVLGAYFAAVCIVFLIRWVKSFIPTVAN